MQAKEEEKHEEEGVREVKRNQVPEGYAVKQVRRDAVFQVRDKKGNIYLIDKKKYAKSKARIFRAPFQSCMYVLEQVLKGEKGSGAVYENMKKDIGRVELMEVD